MSQKVLSVRELKKRQKYIKNKSNLEYVQFNPLSLSLLGFSLIAEIYLIIKYIGKEPSAYYSILLLALGTTALMGCLLLSKGKIFTYELSFLRGGWEGLKYLLGIFSLVAGIGFMMMLVKTTFRYALKLIDIYFYYLAGAVIEEAFFRMFLISLFMKINPYNKWVGIVIGVLVSSLIFMIIHWSVYGHSVYLMASMFFGGLIFSIYYLIFKDITITMLAHLIINFIVVFTQIGITIQVA